MALSMEVGLGLGHIVLNGDPPPIPKKGAEPPNFRPFLLCPNGWLHQDATWYGDRPQPRRLCVRWGPSPSPKRGANPQFLAHVYCDQMAGWINMALCMEVGLGLGYIVLNGDPASLPKKGAEPPIFCPFYCGQMAGCIKVPFGISYGGKLQPK